MNEAPEIKDYDAYINRMDLSAVDKLFFADKIQPDLVVDFGCANGTLLRNLKSLCPSLDVIGYDADPKMVAHSTDAVHITDSWKMVESEISMSKRPALILSSVIHEVFHYGSRADIDAFWKKVLGSGFYYIVVRDMVPSRTIDHSSCVNDVKKIYHKFLGTKALTDFERIWGSVENNRNLVHFLLKYRYLEPNWDREVRENYLPLAREDLLAKIPLDYDVVFHEHYVLPYILQTIRDDIGIELKDPTHLKLILRRN
jgi:SAM-dependent methyltransferase